jgi:parallel beta-helix repeat protein
VTILAASAPGNDSIGNGTSNDAYGDTIEFLANESSWGGNQTDENYDFLDIMPVLELQDSELPTPPQCSYWESYTNCSYTSILEEHGGESVSRRLLASAEVGDELVPNPDFDPCNGWGFELGGAYVSGKAHIFCNSNMKMMQFYCHDWDISAYPGYDGPTCPASDSFWPIPDVAIEAGRTYNISINVIKCAGGNYSIQLGGESTQFISETGIVEVTLTAINTDNLRIPMNLYSYGGSYNVPEIQIDDVSVRELVCTPDLVNTSWSEWQDASPCLENNSKLQERTLIQYDLNGCTGNNTITELRWDICNYYGLRFLSETSEGSGPDSDCDGINDWWEQEYGFPTNDASLPSHGIDSDGDGVSDYNEGVQGTNPYVSDSFAITFVRLEGDRMVLRMNTFRGNNYTIEGAASITNPEWVEVAQFFGGEGSETEVSVPMDGPVGFFRARAWPIEGECEPESGFVTVEGTNFMLDGEPFYFSGANAYFAWYGKWDCDASNPVSGGVCSAEALDDALEFGFKVIRVWGFSDGPEYWGVLQNPNETYIEASFLKYDRLIEEARNRGLKLIIPLVNNWNNFGGMCRYVEWCNLPNADSCDPNADPETLGASVHDLFYTNECTKRVYRNYVEYFLNRNNTRTGILYKDDPTIMAWQLGNEIRARSDPSGEILNAWVDEMSTYIKSIDLNHLVSTGEDGFYVSGGSFDYGYNGEDGSDFIMNGELPNIDFLSFHSYRWDNHNISNWVKKHAEDALFILKKPVILGEFGYAAHSPSFEGYMGEWYDLVEEHRINGDLVWMLCPTNFNGEDGNRCINYPGSSITQRIIDHSQYMDNYAQASNSAPVLEPIDDIYVNAGDVVVITASASDPDGDLLHYSIDSTLFEQDGNIFTWQTSIFANGEYRFRIVVNDGNLGDSKVFSVFVNGTYNCIIPENNMMIVKDTTLCPGSYYLPDGITISASNVLLACEDSELLGNKTGNGINVIPDGRTNITVRGCRISDYSKGIKYWYHHSYGNFLNNTFINCSYGIDAREGAIGQNKIIGNKFINSGLYLHNVHNGIVSGNLFENCLEGISLHKVEYTNFTKNHIEECSRGIITEMSHWNRFEGNTIQKSSSGVYFRWGGSSGYFLNNTFIGNTNAFLHTTYDSTSLNYTIRGNDIVGGSYGINLGRSRGFNITENNFIGNHNAVLMRSGTENNTIYRNNFVNSTSHPASDESVNSWSYNDQGNYWSDYDTSAEGCNDANVDGICDDPRPISGGDNFDYFPFTTESGWENPQNPYGLVFLSETSEGSGPDSDCDGINDWWEQEYGFPTNDASLPSHGIDSDGDGVSDYNEGVQGTNPYVSDSFAITFVRLEGDRMVLRMNTFPGNNYTIEGAASITNPNWVEVAQFFGGEGSETEVSVPMDGPVGFFRARAWPINVECDPHLIFYEPFESVDTIAENSGTYSGSPIFGTGALGNAVKFQNFVINYPVADNIDKNEGTVSFWVKPIAWNTAGNGGNGFFDWGNLGTTASMAVFSNSGGHVYFEITDDAGAQHGPLHKLNALDLGRWNHIAIVFKFNDPSGRIKLYVDGVLALDWSRNIAFNPTDLTFTVGDVGWYSGANSYIDELKVYDVMRTSAEILEDYEKVVEQSRPKIISHSPDLDNVFCESGNEEFGASATALNPVEISWELDGVSVGTGESYSLDCGALSYAAHSLKAVASDGNFQDEHSWGVVKLHPEWSLFKDGDDYSSISGDYSTNSHYGGEQPGINSVWIGRHEDGEFSWSGGEANYVFPFPSEEASGSKEAYLEISWDELGIYSREPWGVYNDMNVEVYIGSLSIFNITNRFHCGNLDRRYYYGQRCGDGFVRIPILGNTLGPSTTVTIKTNPGTVFEISNIGIVSSRNKPVIISNGKLISGGAEFLVKGMGYAPWIKESGPDASQYQKPFPGEFEDVTERLRDGSGTIHVKDYNGDGRIEMWEVIEYDMELIERSGSNAIRTYASGVWHDKNRNGVIDEEPHYLLTEVLQGDMPNWAFDRIMDYGIQKNIKTIIGYWVQEENCKDENGEESGWPMEANEEDLEIAKETFGRIVQRYKNHPSVLAWGIGNEVHLPENHAWFDWGVDINWYLNELNDHARSIDNTERPVMYTKYVGEDVDFSSSNADIIAINAYTHPADEPDLLAQFTVSHEESECYIMGEFGHNIGDVPGHWEIAQEHAGGFFLEYSDVWWKGVNDQFGMVDQFRSLRNDRLGPVYYKYTGISSSCTDGTLEGQCSASKPYYCEGALVESCARCGCPEGYACKGDGTCEQLGSITAHLVQPLDEEDAVRNNFFSITTRVECSTGYCGNVRAVLDPINVGTAESPPEPQHIETTAEVEGKVGEISRRIEQKGGRWEAGLTPLAFYTEEQRETLLSTIIDTEGEQVSLSAASGIRILDSLPTSFDWRSHNGHNWVTPVKNQGMCGSCWAFAAIGAMEATFRVQSGYPDLTLDLSEQELLSCGNAGTCEGGSSVSALYYIKGNGITDEGCFPYVASDVSCSLCADYDIRRKNIYEYVHVPGNTEAYKSALIEYGPLVVGLDSGEDFMYYTSGVYEPLEDIWDGTLNHVVVLVGYNDDEGYWIVKNSWGSGWGEAGYGKVAYGNLEQYNYSYAITNIEPAWVVPMHNGDPFYTIDQNPNICFDMKQGDSCEMSWSVNATGEGSHEMFTKYVPYLGIENKDSQRVNITIIDSEECESDEDCDDGVYCNGEETCVDSMCVSGTPINCISANFCEVNGYCDEGLMACVYEERDCSGNDLPAVASCVNMPDGNPWTWDYFGGFVSVCDPLSSSCSSGIAELTHTCNLSCEAECASDGDCDDGNPETIGTCLGNCSCAYEDIGECVMPTDGMVIEEDTVFCGGEYELPNGVSIGADDITLDCNGATLVGSYYSSSGIRADAKGAIIKNCEVTGYINGLYSMTSNNISFRNNKAHDNRYGAFVGSNVYSIAFVGNTLHSNRWTGIIVYAKGGSYLEGNIISSNGYYNPYPGYGMWLGDDSKHKLRNNIMYNNSYDFSSFVFGGVYHDIDESNTINGRPIYYWIRQSDREIPSDAGYVHLNECNNITLSNLNLSGNICGAILHKTTNSTINNLTIWGNVDGLMITSGSSENLIQGNNIHNNLETGIRISGGSQYNEVLENTINNNLERGLYIVSSSYNKIEKNNIAENRKGIVINWPYTNQDVFNNSIEFNNIFDNVEYNFQDSLNYIVSMKNNWWGSIVESEIAESIFDSGNVDFDPWLYGPFDGNSRPIPSDLECQSSGSWKSCRELTSADTLTAVRASCIDLDGSITSALFKLEEIVDYTTIFTGEGVQNGNIWTYDNDDLLLDYDGLKLSVTCDDDEGESNGIGEGWLLGRNLLFYESFEGMGSIQSNDGTVSGTVRIADFPWGEAGDMTSSGYVSYPLEGNFKSNGRMTLEFWVKPEHFGSHGFFGINTIGVDQHSMGIYHNGRVITEIRNSNGQAHGPGGFTSKRWHHVAVTMSEYDQNNCFDLITYLDGSPGWTKRICNFFPDLNGTFRLGWTGYYDYMNGYLDEFKIFDYARSDSEIYESYLRMRNITWSEPEKKECIMHKPQSTGPVQINCSGLYVDGEPFKMNGIGYQPMPIGTTVNVAGGSDIIFNTPAIYNRDFPLLRDMNANTIRTWAKVVNSSFLDAAWNGGVDPVYVAMGFWMDCSLNYNDAEVRQNYIDDFTDYVEEYKDHPAVLMWLLGNEANICLSSGSMRAYYSLCNELAEIAYGIEGSSYHPVGIVNWDLFHIGLEEYDSDDISQEFTDFWGSNVYPGETFGTWFDDYSGLSGKPLMITEYGIDALDNSNKQEYEEVQSEWVLRQWQEIDESDITIGSTLMAYSDEWWKASGNLDVQDYGGYPTIAHPDGFSNEEWWGVMRIVKDGSNPDIMQPRQVYGDLRDAWAIEAPEAPQPSSPSPSGGSGGGGSSGGSSGSASVGLVDMDRLLTRDGLSSTAMGQGDELVEESKGLSIIIPGDIREGMEFTIVVIDENGNPIEGALVTYGGKSAITGPDGKASFIAEGDSVSLFAEKEGFGRHEIQAAIIAMSDLSLESIESPTGAAGAGKPMSLLNMIIIGLSLVVAVEVVVYIKRR